MTQIDQIIADALAGSPETHVAILAREVVRLREASAVAVPDITDDDFESISILMQENGIGCHSEDDESFRRIVASTWAYTQGFCDIPSPSTRSAGMEGSVRDAYMEGHFDGVQWSGQEEEDANKESDWQSSNSLAALRARQGGADHD